MAGSVPGEGLKLPVLRFGVFVIATLLASWMAITTADHYWFVVNRYDLSDAVISCVAIAACWAVAVAGLFRLLLPVGKSRLTRRLAMVSLVAAVLILLMLATLPGIST